MKNKFHLNLVPFNRKITTVHHFLYPKPAGINPAKPFTPVLEKWPVVKLGRSWLKFCIRYTLANLSIH